MSSVFPITDDPRYRRITASAGQTVFSIGFPFLQNEDIGIYLQTAPSQYTLFDPSAYTLTGANNPAGGSATFHSPRSAGDIVLILGAAVLDRMSSIVRDGKFSSALTDGELDRIRIIQQEFSRDADRAIKVDYGGEGVTLASDLEDGDVLMKDGNRLVRGPKAADIASAQTNAEAAKASENAAAASAETATTKASSASSSATLAGRWATAPEDEEVVPTTGLFSAFHWYRKTLAIWNNVIAGWSGAVHNAPLKASPSLADEFGFADSGDSWKIKKQTFAKLQEVFGVPIGTTIIMQGTTNNPPPGFLLHNGASCPASYPQLRQWLIDHGAALDANGDPIIEDMGGYFPRGWRPGQVVDSGRVFGSVQQDAMQRVQGEIGGLVGGAQPITGAFSTDGAAVPNGYGGGGGLVRQATFDNARVARTANENRPANKTFTYWIKAYAADLVPGSADFAALANNVQVLQTAVDAKGTKRQPALTPSGTATTLSGIPAGVQALCIKLSGIQFSASAQPTLRLGSSSGLLTSGYSAKAVGFDGTALNTHYGTTFIALLDVVANFGSTPLWGHIELKRSAPGSTKWTYFGSLTRSATGPSYFGGGVDLGAELTQIQLSSAAGTASISGTNALSIEWEF